jgi:MurNAc alpha-1-phosphate uridylyltransferase
MNAAMPSAAMVLAAGLGTRMRPLTETRPKPLIPVAGRALIDWGLDALAQADVCRAVVNVHHLAGQMRAHLAGRTRPQIVISDETDRLRDSGGGIVHAMPHLGSAPFFVLNADTFWIDRDRSNLVRLAESFDAGAMDMILLLARPGDATGHDGGGDFLLAADGRLQRAGGDRGAFIYAGAAIARPEIFAGSTDAPHSLNRYFDRAIAAGRLFGLVLDGHWITVGTPAAIGAAEAALAMQAAAIRR